jgi:hypothetical protein
MDWYWYMIVALTVFDLGFLLGTVWLSGRVVDSSGSLIAYPSLHARHLVGGPDQAPPFRVINVVRD